MSLHIGEIGFRLPNLKYDYNKQNLRYQYLVTAFAIKRSKDM